MGFLLKFINARIKHQGFKKCQNEVLIGNLIASNLLNSVLCFALLYTEHIIP